MNRLETVDLKLVTSLKSAESQKQLAAVLAGCEFAVNTTGLRHPAVEASLELLRHEGKIGASLKAQLDELTKKYDTEYFLLQKQSLPDATRPFSQARAASALSFAAALPALDAVCDSLYEASVTVDDPTELFERLRKMVA